MSTNGLSPVMKAYAHLVAVYREWNACDMTDSHEVAKLLRRIDQAKGRLAVHSGERYVSLWKSAVSEAKIQTEEDAHATHPTA